MRGAQVAIGLAAAGLGSGLDAPAAAACLVSAAYLMSAACGVFAAETHRRRVFVVAKPLTTLLLLGVVGVPATPFARWIAAGIVLSWMGDVALPFAADRAFMAGLGAFLMAHVSYGIAFASKARLSGWAWRGYAAGMLVATAILVRRLWPGAAGMRAPVVAYAATIASMTILAFATTTTATATITALGAGVSALPPLAARLAAIGALLFFVSDSALALSKFRRPIPHSAFLTLGLYWLGQLGIAWAARLA